MAFKPEQNFCQTFHQIESKVYFCLTIPAPFIVLCSPAVDRLMSDNRPGNVGPRASVAAVYLPEAVSGRIGSNSDSVDDVHPCRAVMRPCARLDKILLKHFWHVRY